MRTHLLLLLLAIGCGGKDDTGEPGVDQDADGFVEGVDCDDNDANVHPDALEQPYNGVDDDCDEGTPDDDLDADGYIAEQDCDDNDASAYPGGTEVCDGADNDCDGTIDDNALDTLAWYEDYDGDGYGNPDAEILACDLPPGHVADDSDCDDTDPQIHPGAQEPYDGVDNDCDGDIDEEGGAPVFDWYHDGDGDGFGDPYDLVEAEKQPYGYVPNDNDCDDEDAAIYPDAPERCNDLDDDCDSLLDEDDACVELDVATADDWWTGDGSGDEAGFALAGGHDLTGDGTDDFLVGAPETGPGGSFYVMAGDYLGYATGLELDAASSSGAITWSSPMSGAELGHSVALFRDADGDGVTDFGVGAPYADGPGVAVLWFSSVSDYEYVSVSGSLAELGEVASAADVNRDGYTDILIGGPGVTTDSGDEGFAEIFLGDPTDLLVAGEYWTGESANDALGSQLASAGDVDGDGFFDVLIGAQGYPGGDRQGAIYMAMGRGLWPGGEGELADLEHFFVGDAVGDHAGQALAGGEDFNGDGYDDFVMSAPYASPGGSDEGEVYLWFGDAVWARGDSSWSLSSAPTSFAGEDASSRAGWALSFVPDFDGDGQVDLAVGAPYFSSGGALTGKLYLVSSSAGIWAGACDLADASHSWVGEDPGDHLGSAIAVGDADADGLSDIMVSATGADDNGTSSGSVYLLLGW